MKRRAHYLIRLLALALVLPAMLSCRKKEYLDPGYGCDTKQVAYSLNSTPATLFYMNSQYQQAWFLQVDYPNNGKHLLRICNLDQARELLKGVTTSTTIPVYASGDVKDFGPDESIGITAGIVSSYHVTLTSITKQ
jgi:hypothetical protein